MCSISAIVISLNWNWNYCHIWQQINYITEITLINIKLIPFKETITQFVTCTVKEWFLKQRFKKLYEKMHCEKDIENGN